MSSDPKVVERIRALLELTRNPSRQEATAAAAAAQKLMTKHGISIAEIQAKAEPIGERVFQHRGKIFTWERFLIKSLCDVNPCEAMRRGDQIIVIGKPRYTETVYYLYRYLWREINRLADREAEIQNRPGHTYLANYRIGIVIELDRRLKKAAKEARSEIRTEAESDGGGVALARIDKSIAAFELEAKEVADFMKSKKLRKSHGSRIRSDKYAYKRGRRAGKKILLESGPGLPGGAKGELK